MDSYEFGELDDADIGEEPQGQLNKELSKEFKKFDKPTNASCKIPHDLLDKLKTYIFIQGEKENEFSIEDLKIEFSDNFEVPDDVDLEEELAKLGIVKLKYAPGNRLKLVPRPEFLDNFYEEKSNSMVTRKINCPHSHTTPDGS